ncbi:hypothetical protein BH20VER2_BH20VER2_10470 [soil metagenome]
MDENRPRFLWLWVVLFLLFLVATIIDLIAGYTARTLSSASLAVACGLLALGLPRRQRGGWLIVFLLVAIAMMALAYHLTLWVSTSA